MTIKPIFILAFFINAFSLHAQTAEDILRYSFRQPLGTARTLGLAGAWSTGGADISAANINPAGLGFYRRNELIGSAAISALRNNAEYVGTNSDDSRTNFNIPNIGVVFNNVNSYKGKDATEGIVAGSFAFGLNRANNFQQNLLISGNVSNSSRSNALALAANGQDSAGFFNRSEDNNLGALAWRLTVIDNFGSPTRYGSRFQIFNDNDYKVSQDIARTVRGRNNEYFIGGGLNVSNLIYLGGSLIISAIELTSEQRYSETVLSTSTTNSLQSFTVNEFYRTTGYGAGGRFGVIVRPTDFIRFGAAYHTAIRHNLTDFYQNTMSVYLNGNVFTEPPQSREDFFEYQLITPSRIVLGGSFLFKELFMINYDYESVNYTSGRLTSSTFAFNNENTFAKNNFNRNAVNHRVGAEINYGGFKWRGGFAYSQTPYNTNIFRTNKADRMGISLGLGTIIDRTITVDVAMLHWFGKSYYTPYNGAPTATILNNFTNVVVGVGYRF
ncbi:MAG: OmpP1/FadL family transporter [Bacteroidia bacterium]